MLATLVYLLSLLVVVFPLRVYDCTASDSEVVTLDLRNVKRCPEVDQSYMPPSVVDVQIVKTDNDMEVDVYR